MHTDPLILGRVFIYALFDRDTCTSKKDIKRINLKDAHTLNKEGYGIFHSVNSFYGTRKKENIARINSWFVEIDLDSQEEKPEVLKKIRDSGLIPTQIVESKNGFHVYWACYDDSLERCVSTWERVVKRGLIPFYKADTKASDYTRILRRPDFFHMKNPNDPFLVKKIWECKAGYTIREMMKHYPDNKKKKEHIRLVDSLKKRFTPENPEFWDNVEEINCEYGLNKLSGSEYVRGEIYSFIDHHDGTKQIVVNGKQTSCWIDKDGLIGSYDQGGPTIAQWLNWYVGDYNKTFQAIKEVFPQCSKKTQLTLL